MHSRVMVCTANLLMVVMFVYSAHGGDIFVIRYADGASLKLTTKQGSNIAPQWHRGIKTL